MISSFSQDTAEFTIIITEGITQASFLKHDLGQSRREWTVSSPWQWYRWIAISQVEAYTGYKCPIFSKTHRCICKPIPNVLFLFLLILKSRQGCNELYGIRSRHFFLALVQYVGGRVDNFSHFGSKTVTE